MILGMKFFPLFIAAAVSFAALVWVTSPYKIGLSPDSSCYIEMGRNLAAGKGAYVKPSPLAGSMVPVTGYAPFLSFVLAVPAYLKADLQITGWLLNGFLFAAANFLSGWIVYACTGSPVYALLAPALLSLDLKWTEYFFYVLSEPLFATLALFEIFCLIRYLKDQQMIWIGLASLTAGAAALTRYVGVSYIMAGVFSVFLFTHDGLKKRLGAALCMGAPSSAIFLAWVVRNRRASGSFFGTVFSGADQHTLSFWPNIRSVLRDTVNYPSNSGMLRHPIFFYAFLALVPVAFALNAFVKKEKGSSSDLRVALILFLFAASYLSVLILALTGGHSPSNPEKFRYISPLYGQLWCLLPIVMHIIQKQAGEIHKILSGAVGTLFLIVLIAWFVPLAKINWERDLKIRLYGADRTQGERWKDFKSIGYPAARWRMARIPERS